MNKIFSATLFTILLSGVLFGVPYVTSAQTPTSTPPDTKAVIKQLQELVKSLQSQILDLQIQLKAAKGEIAEVKAEVKELKITQNLFRGSKGDEVTQLQEFLKRDPAVYPEGQVTGFFGPATEAAVKRFQEKHGIESIGVIGPKTRAKLNEIFTSSFVKTSEDKKGAGESGVIPSGLLRAPGIQTQKEPSAAAPTTSATTLPEGKITVCHIPPGEPTNKQTLEIDQSALGAHLAHGDTIAVCVSPLPPPPPPTNGTTTATTTPPATPPPPPPSAIPPPPATTPPPPPATTPPPPSAIPPPPATPPPSPPPSNSTTTTVTTDTTSPVISNIQAANITSNSAIITWTTNELSDSQVEYGVINAYGSASTIDTSFITSHTMSITGLSAGTTYHYRVKSKDTAGNLATSGDQMFTASASGAAILPAPTDILIGWYKGSFDGQPPTGKYQMVISFLYTGNNLSNVKSFRLYLKRPGDSSFLTSTYLNPSSIDAYCNNYIYSGTWKMRNCTSFVAGGHWQILDPGNQQSSAYPSGEYNAYVVAVNNDEVESPVSSIAKDMLRKTTVLSPIGPQNSLTPQFRWSVPSDWPGGRFWMEVNNQNSSYWLPSSFYTSTGVTEGSTVYNGPVLNPSGTYYINLWGREDTSLCCGAGFIVMADSNPLFTVSSTTATTSVVDTTNLAALLKSLSQILKTLEGVLK